MITVTEKATNHIKEMMKSEGMTEGFVRLSVQGGGCSGLSYGLGFVPEKDETDNVLDFNGVTFVIDEESAPIVQGTVIDFKESMMGGGFVIDNPNAIASCGCGSSFRTKTVKGTPEEC